MRWTARDACSLAIGLAYLVPSFVRQALDAAVSDISAQIDKYHKANQ